MINKALDLGIPEAAETYSSSEHFYSEMHIPTSATGRLPRSSRTREGLSAEKVEDLGETGKNHRGGPPERGRSSAGRGGGARSGGPSGRGKSSGHGSDQSSGNDSGNDSGNSSGRGTSEGRERPPADRTKADRPDSSTDHPMTSDDTRPRRSRNRRRTRGGQGDSAGAGATTA